MFLKKLVFVRHSLRQASDQSLDNDEGEIKPGEAQNKS